MYKHTYLLNKQIIQVAVPAVQVIGIYNVVCILLRQIQDHFLQEWWIQETLNAHVNMKLYSYQLSSVCVYLISVFQWLSKLRNVCVISSLTVPRHKLHAGKLNKILTSFFENSVDHRISVNIINLCLQSKFARNDKIYCIIFNNL